MNAPTIWLILGIVFIIIEVSAIPGIGFLFAGLGSLTLGGLITFNFIHTTNLTEEIAYLFFLTGLWWIILWKPLKRATKKFKGEEYQNLVGTYGTADEELKAGKIGYVKWSGARMRARIRPESSAEVIPAGETVYIHEQKDGVLLIDITKPEN